MVYTSSLSQSNTGEISSEKTQPLNEFRPRREALWHPEGIESLSQNMGHEGMMTTFTSYGEVSRERQAHIIRSLNDEEAPGGDLPAVKKGIGSCSRDRPAFSRSDRRLTRSVAEALAGRGENVFYPLMRQLHAVLSNGG
jgi:hypothetical protein